MTGIMDERQDNKKTKGNIEMGDKSPKAIRKKSAHDQTKTRKAKKQEKHSALVQRSTTTMKK